MSSRLATDQAGAPASDDAKLGTTRTQQAVAASQARQRPSLPWPFAHHRGRTRLKQGSMPCGRERRAVAWAGEAGVGQLGRREWSLANPGPAVHPLCKIHFSLKTNFIHDSMGRICFLRFRRSSNALSLLTNGRRAAQRVVLRLWRHGLARARPLVDRRAQHPCQTRSGRPYRSWGWFQRGGPAHAVPWPPASAILRDGTGAKKRPGPACACRGC